MASVSIYKVLDFAIFGVIASIVIQSSVLQQEKGYALFFEKDPAISYYKQTDDLVPTSALYGICLSISLIVISLCYFSSHVVAVTVKSGSSKYAQVADTKHRFMAVFVLGLGYLVCVLSANSVTSVLKIKVSRARPIALYHCNYLGYKTAVDSGNFTAYSSLATFGKVGDVSNCWDQNNMEDAWSSFPSGHASFSFSSMVYVFFLVRKVVQVPDSEFFSWKSAFSFIPIVISTWIAVTRVIDWKHHVEDVLTGALIGIACAMFSWWNTEYILPHFLTVAGCITIEDSYNQENSGSTLQEGLVDESSIVAYSK